MIEGDITEVKLKGEGIEQFGIGPLLAAVQAERPARLSTLERQMLLINDRPGVRVVDTTLEELGGPTGRFRLVVQLQTWRIYSASGLDNLGSSAVGPRQTYATAAFNSYLAPGDTLAVNLSTIAKDPRELTFGRLSYDVPVGTDGIRIGASALYSEVWPGDFRRLSHNRTRTETFELRGSVAPLQSQASSLVVTAAFGFSDVSQSDIYGSIYNDDIRTLTLTGDYKFRDDFKGVNYLTVVGRQGLEILGASQADDAWLRAPGSRRLLGVQPVLHALPDAVGRMVGQRYRRPASLHRHSCCSRSNSIWAAQPSGAGMAVPKSAATTRWLARSSCASIKPSVRPT